MSAAERDDGCEWYFGVPFLSKRKEAEAAVKERELKVGDRVRVTNDGNGDNGSSHGAVVGSIDVIDGGLDDYGYVHGESGWFYRPDELTLLPTFPPNTRVRLIRNTNHYAVGDTGTVTVSSDESVGVHMDDGRYWSFKPEDLVVIPVPRGVAHVPDCAGRNGEQACWPAKQEAKPKFKAGDVVRSRLEDWSGAIRAGDTFTLTDAYDAHVGIVDRDGDDRFLPADDFELVSPTPANDPAQPCIVARVDDGRPRPSNYPHIHADAATATREAERLASVNPGKQFDVYQRVTGRVAEQHIEMKVA